MQESEQYARARDTTHDVWRQTKEGSQKAWAETQTQASKAKEHARTAFQGKSREVTFQEPKLGMTLAREKGGENNKQTPPKTVKLVF